MNPHVTHGDARPLYRSREGRMLTGTADGIARYLDIEVTIIRVAFAVLALLGGSGIPLYLIAWVLIPEEGSGESIAQDLVGRFRWR